MKQILTVLVLVLGIQATANSTSLPQKWNLWLSALGSVEEFGTGKWGVNSTYKTKKACEAAKQKLTNELRSQGGSEVTDVGHGAFKVMNNHFWIIWELKCLADTEKPKDKSK